MNPSLENINEQRAITEDLLIEFVSQGYSQRKMATLLECSQTNIRYYLRKYNVTYEYKPSTGTDQIVCPKHNTLYKQYKQSSGKYKRQCSQCDNERINKRRDDMQREILKIHGSQCSRCGYNRCSGAIHFHHLNQDKQYSLSKIFNYKKSTILKEIEKCELLCANCHMESEELKRQMAYHEISDLSYSCNIEKMIDCSIHGMQKGTRKILYQDKYMENCCPRCLQIARVREHYQRNKKKLCNLFNSECQKCGYNKSEQALQFHHIDPSLKSFSLSSGKLYGKIEALIKEALKCQLLCANCHAEHHFSGNNLLVDA